MFSITPPNGVGDRRGVEEGAAVSVDVGMRVAAAVNVSVGATVDVVVGANAIVGGTEAVALVVAWVGALVGGAAVEVWVGLQAKDMTASKIKIDENRRGFISLS